MISRRRLLGALCLTLTPLAGCGKAKSLGIEFTTVHVRDGESSVRIEVTVTGEVNGVSQSSSWAEFDDVSVVGYDSGANAICEENVGTIHPRQTATVVLKCRSVPTYLSFTATQRPCGSTEMDIWKYDQERAKFVWVAERECEAGRYQTVSSATK